MLLSCEHLFKFDKELKKTIIGTDEAGRGPGAGGVFAACVYFNNISHDKKVLETFICRYAETLDEFDFSAYPGNARIFAIRLRETGRLIGILTFFDDTAESCEIGYGLGSRYWNAGYATEAVRRFIRYLFGERGLRTVYASFFTGNEASRRVMEKCGMTFCRFSEKELTYLGAERDLTYYSLDNPEADPR